MHFCIVQPRGFGHFADMYSRSSLTQRTLAILAGSLLLAGITASAYSAPFINQMTSSANAFLASLDDERRAQATFEWKDEERVNWHFIPRERKGLPLDAMTDGQRVMAHALLSHGMSYNGYNTSMTIMSLESILAELENNPVRRDSGKYFFSIFGKPANGKSWGWRVEGHHLSLNFTIANGKHVRATPSFYGNNPGRVREGSRKGLATLVAEENMARNILKSMNAGQKKQAIIADVAPKDIITKADTMVKPLEETGIRFSKLNDAQKKQIKQIVRLYVNRHRPEIAREDLKKIEAAGWDEVLFAWAGPEKRGEGHYYRVQGPTFLLEYDNVQNGANHIHAVYRDFKSDFGADLLKAHYAKHHSND